MCKNYYNIKINSIIEMKKFKVKFFGSRNRKEQIKLQKTEVEAESRDKVEDKLRSEGWEVINGLKIHDL